MTDLINQISINNKTTTFLNYVNPLTGGVIDPVTIYGNSLIQQLFTAHLGVVGGSWNYRSTYRDSFCVRFPVPWETLSGAIPAGSSDVVSNSRISLAMLFQSSAGQRNFFNTSSTTTLVKAGKYVSENTSSFRHVVFGVLNDYAVAFGCFPNQSRSSCYFVYGGWAKDPQYDTGSVVFPRNLVYFSSTEGFNRVTQENSTAAPTTLSTQNPTLSCSIATPGANSTDVIIRNSAAPNNYIGKLWNMMVLPSTAVVGKIYKNTGIDPDTGQVETDQKAFWMCVGSWGTDKIGMRVWTENIT